MFVPPESPIRTPADLRGVPISVGYKSGSHYSTLQALERYLPREDIKLSFADGILFGRLEKLVDRAVPAAAVFSGAYYFLEQLGFRKLIDTTFMIATLLSGAPHAEDVRRYFRALRRAQHEIDTRRWGPGARIVFEPYSREVFEASFAWIAEREIFERAAMGAGRYEEAVVSLNA